MRTLAAVRLAARPQAVQRILTNRLEHGDTWRVVALRRPEEQALGEERGEGIQYRLRGGVCRGADRLDRIERGAACEDRQAREEPLLVRRQQFIAPVDRRAQRLLARGEIALAARQE